MNGARRTSRRKRVPSKRYSTDAFQGYEGLSEDSIDDVGVSRFKRRQTDADEDFGELDAVVAAAVENDDDDEDGVAESLSASSSDRELEADEDEVISDAESNNVRRRERRRRRTGNALRPSEAAKLPAFDTRIIKVISNSAAFSSGDPDFAGSASKLVQLRQAFGTCSEDLAAYYYSKEKWFSQVTLPTRQPDINGVGGLSYSSFNPVTARTRETEQYQTWYLQQGGRKFFLSNQSALEVAAAHSDPLMPTASVLSLLVGPVKSPTRLNLKTQESVPLQQIRTGVDKSKSKERKSGWIMNLGGYVQCLQWVPNLNNSRQLLSVVVLQPQRSGDNATKDLRTNAFTPKETYRACMQIWEFQCEPGSNVGARPDDLEPSLRAVVSWDWGDLKRMQWCQSHLGEAETQPTDGKLQLGLLAGIWTDGYLRVLDLAIKDSSATTTQYLHIEKAAFQTRPPGSVCSCLAWLSSSALAVGCANGSAGIWHLSNIVASTPEGAAANPRPTFYHELHESYIISITSGYPSRPHLLFTLSLDGNFRLTDIRAPTQDYCHSMRVRVAQGPVAWHDVGQLCFVTDENCTLRAATARRFHAVMQVIKMGGFGTDIATSPVHPMVLCSSVDGTVYATNPLRRGRSMRGQTFTQLWFKHEWRRALPADKAGAEPLLAQPLSRMTEGYKLIRSAGRGELDDGKPLKEGMLTSTVFEEQTSVTHVCWNPNLRCGTWAAAGTANGLLRVEDIGLD